MTDKLPIQFEQAAVAVGPDLIPDNPTSTPQPTGGAAANQGPGVDLGKDKSGDVWTPGVHEDPPRKNDRGRWAKLRGNAARKAKGMPPSGATTGKAFRAAPAPQAPQAAPRMVSDIGPELDFPAPGEHGPGAAAGPGAPEPMPQLMEADYQPTAEALTRSLFGAAALGWGKAWEPRPDESAALTNSLRRVWHHYQLPRLGPILETVTVMVGIFARRRDDEGMRGTFRALARAITGKREPAPPVRVGGDAPAPQAPPPQASAPARGGPLIGH